MGEYLACLRQWSAADGRKGTRLYLWCPGCDDLHAVEVEAAARWEWDGSVEAPTINPSILVQGVQWPEGETFHRPNHHVEAGTQVVCHSYVHGGQWQFLGDSTHALAGQTARMVPLPDWIIKEAQEANQGGDHG